MRMSVGKVGLFWTFAVPFMQVAILISIRVVIMQSAGVDHQSSDYDHIVFMASGFIAFNMFKNILSGATGAFDANKGLFSYKQVKPIDTIVARVLLEMFLTSIVVLLFLFIGFMFQHDIKPENTAMVFIGYVWFAIFSFSFSFLVAVGNHFYLSIGKLIGIISFLLLIGSAIFFPIASIPPAAQEILLYNPLVHFMEMIHAAYIPQLDDRFVDYNYMMLWTLIPLFMGIWLYSHLEHRIISE